LCKTSPEKEVGFDIALRHPASHWVVAPALVAVTVALLKYAPAELVVAPARMILLVDRDMMTPYSER
jgi:hypothetical protein